MRTQKENDQIIAALYKQMFSVLKAYAYNILEDSHHAEEAVQDTFRIACENQEKLLTSPNPKGWLMVTLQNVLKNMLRERARTQEILVDSLFYDENTFVDNRNEKMVDLLYSDLIGKEDYRMLKLVVLRNYTMGEVAKEYGINAASARKRVQRARDKLRIKLKKINKIKK